MDLPTLLHNLGQTLQLDDLQLNPQGVCQLIFDGATAINIEQAPAEATAHLYAVIAPIPAGDPLPLYTRLLQAQLFFREVGDGCAFALDQEASEILLNKRLFIETLDDATFQEALSEFVNWVQHWQQQLSGDLSSADPDDLVAETPLPQATTISDADYLSNTTYLRA